jgi:hypothetical protein
VLDKLSKRLQPKAKEKLHQIWIAPTKADADQALIVPVPEPSSLLLGIGGIAAF